MLCQLPLHRGAVCGERRGHAGPCIPKESTRAPRAVSDEEAREAERRQAAKLSPRERGAVSTLQGRICGVLEGGEPTLEELESELNTDPRAQIIIALGRLYREKLIRPVRTGGVVRYRLEP